MKLELTLEEAAHLHHAVYIAYGSTPRSCGFWQKFRDAAGDNWRDVVELSIKIARSNRGIV